MALADIASRERRPPERRGPLCAVCVTLSLLPDTDVTALNSLMADPTWGYKELSRALASDPDQPLDLPHSTLSRHARGECYAMKVAKQKLR